MQFIGQHILLIPDKAAAFPFLKRTGREECPVTEDGDWRLRILHTTDSHRHLQDEIARPEALHDLFHIVQEFLGTKPPYGNQQRKAVILDASIGHLIIALIMPAQHRANAGQEFIPLRESVEIVDELEIAEIQAGQAICFFWIRFQTMTRLPIKAITVADPRQTVMQRAKMLQVDILLCLRAVAQQEIIADHAAIGIMQRITADGNRLVLHPRFIRLNPGCRLTAGQHILLNPIFQDAGKFLQIIRNAEQPERLTVGIKAAAFLIEPDHAVRKFCMAFCRSSANRSGLYFSCSTA